MNSILSVILAVVSLLFPVAASSSTSSLPVSPGPTFSPALIQEADPATLVSASETEWYSYRQIDADTIRVSFWGGVDECYGYYTVTEETPEAVTVRVFGGVRHGVEFCIDRADYHAIDVDLDSPLGERAVLGASDWDQWR